MAKYPNSGAVFENDRKEKDSHPDRKGQAAITCPGCNQEHEFWLSGWIKNGNGKRFLSLSFKPKEAAKSKPEQSTGPEPTDDPPF